MNVYRVNKAFATRFMTSKLFAYMIISQICKITFANIGIITLISDTLVAVFTGFLILARKPNVRGRHTYRLRKGD